MLAEPLRSAAAALVAASGGRVGYSSTFRTRDEQIALRKDHCGTSQYAIFQMPSSQCNPPTARPGSSQHEIGLAVDFSGDMAVAADLAPRFGLVRTVDDEDWHFEHKDALAGSPRAAALRAAVALGSIGEYVKIAGAGGPNVAQRMFDGSNAQPETDTGQGAAEILTDPSTWLRVAQVLAGFVLAGIGLYLVIGDMSDGR